MSKGNAWDTWPKSMHATIEAAWANNDKADSHMGKVGSGTLARQLRERYRISVSNATLDRYAKARGRQSWSVP